MDTYLQTCRALPHTRSSLRGHAGTGMHKPRVRWPPGLSMHARGAHKEGVSPTCWAEAWASLAELARIGLGGMGQNWAVLSGV